MKKLNVLIINKSEYDLSKFSFLKKKINFFNIENPNNKSLKNFIIKKKLNYIDIFIVNLGVIVNEDLLKLLPNVKVIITPTTGINHIDLKALNRKKIKLLSLAKNKKLNTVTSTAEHAWGLVLSLSRNIIPYYQDVIFHRNWRRNLFINNNFQLYGKTIGILGYGRLGKMIYRYAKSFGMKILIFEKNKKKNLANYSSLQKIFKISDVVSVNLDYNKSTHGIITKKIISYAKDRQILINTSRGEVIEEGVLQIYLDKKKNRRAGLDVLINDSAWSSKIPLNFFNYIKKYKKKLILTPHVGGVSIDSRNITREIVLNYLYKFIKP